MRTAIIICAIFLLASAQTTSQPKRVVIAASTVFDGRGKIIHDARIVIEGTKIVAIDQKSAPVDYDLRGLTVMPGWIDSHVHISWGFDADGKNAGPGATTPYTRLQVLWNGLHTLKAGFTTVQSVGHPVDLIFREIYAKGTHPGPRLLTAAEPLIGQGPQSGTPEEIRAFVRKQKAAGADLIKIFASNSIRRPEPTLSEDQLTAACDEAKKLGLRTLVHAYKDAVRLATLAGCTQVE